MSCKYIFNGESGLDYQELISKLSEEEIETALSILYKMSQTEMYDAIMEKKQDYAFTRWDKSNFNGIDGAPSIDTGKNMSIQQFIDSKYFVINGERPTFQMVFEDYLTYKKDELVKNNHMNEDLAEEYINKFKDKWEIIAKDAYDLHKLIVSAKSQDGSVSYQELSNNAVDTAFQNIVDKLEEAASNVIRKVFLPNGIDKVGSGKKGMLIKNINLGAQLKGLDEQIIGHIDYLIVRDNGDIEIFNLKSSIEGEQSWDFAKKEKYRYQMAILKRILEFNGIPAKHIRMNIIPIKMVYDDNYNLVIDIEVGSVIPLDQKDREYTLRNYDKVAEKFVLSNVKIDEINSEDILKLHTQLLNIFPGQNIDTFGIKETAKSWVQRYWKQLKPTPLDGGGWEITLPGQKEPIQISDSKFGANNEAIVSIVEENLNDLSNNIQHEWGIYRTITDIQNAYERQGFYSPSGEYGNYLRELFSKYFEHPTVGEDGKFHYTWKLLSNNLLQEAGILVFLNKYTNQIDVITLTNYDVVQEYKFKGRNNLLGYYLPDMNDYGFTLKSDYGNIEAIRTMTILNEALPHIQGDIKLGDLKVLGISHQIHGVKGRLFDLSRLSPQFDTVLDVVNKNTKANIENNFKKLNIKYVDQADILVQEWNEIITSPSNESLIDIKDLDQYITLKSLVDGTTIDGLIQAPTIEAKVEKLELLINKLKQMANDRGIPIGKTDLLLQLANSTHNDFNSAIAKLYLLATKTLNQYFGDLSLENEKFSMFEEYGLKTSSSSNSNLRTVSAMFTRSIDKIAGEMVNRYTPIREVFMKFYEDAGYTPTQNAVIGNQASVYESLYELDLLGLRTMQFKNPYDNTNDLKDYEREFLKNILFEFHKIRCEIVGMKNEISGPNDTQLTLGKMPSQYLNAPLERASKATRRLHAKEGFKLWGKRVWRALTKPKEFFEELNGLINLDEIRQREDDIKNLQAYNPFKNSEKSLNVRNSYILDKGVNYFEYNVENLFIDYLEKHIQAEEYTKLLTRVKGIELDLILKGEVEYDDKYIKRTLKAIDDFLKINVFNQSIMEEDSQKLEARLAPLRRVVSSMYIAGNVAGAVRDTFLGLLENISSAIIKFQTDIRVKDVAFGYKEVVSEGINNLMTITKLNLFNLKYRFSNLDVARISEGQKTDRGGLLNGENWAYSTLRGPDYLNRMVLFVAKMNHDGCYDAYKLNNEKRLEYDWRLDKRFELFAQGEEGKAKNKEEYNKQKSLYYSLIRQFNMEGYKKEDGTQLTYTDPLPDAYTLQEIQTFKHFSDTIYGSYNKSTKAKYEFTVLGRNFAFFSTWMNGIVDTYMKSTQVSQNEIKQQQEVDYNGNPLFFEEDGTITDVDTGVPVMKGVPVMVLGIFATLNLAIKTFYYCGMDENGNWSASKGWSEMKSEVFSNDVARRNRRRLMRDMLVSLLLAGLFKLCVDPAYKDHKKRAKGEAILTNAAIEILYKSSRNCFDTFTGPIAVLDYLGNQTNPSTYKVQSKIFNDLGSFVFGDKTFGLLVMGSQALPRSFQDTYHIWARENKTSNSEK